ncbi:alcohol dehydrogenase catalytic domain-containing protein [Actinoalloteichus caeruleus]|uniref:L-idonate 5-dehydrogenase n=1 Tax=Actinoalloteichus caeruleus DSM 43889 TaxID=1120930 RepID=A0ABT1JLR3_ACTCY|nr:alcohol dehydrogenase catalytic domain-containing protein [Actinoalloteichus caeruleus]MCP2333455.1 L-idonate 5-dehydrogenase [Actinoalloteichus caeruleus DSM 43889]
MSRAPSPSAPAPQDTLAVVAHAAGDVRLDRVPLPEPTPAEAVVRIAYGGICGSDLHYWRHGAAGESVLRSPMVLGHEVVGHVERAAADGSGPAAGTPVAVHPANPCGTCDRCAEGRENICPRTTYLGSAARHPHTDGGFAALRVLPATRLLPLPAGLPPRAAALAEPAAVAWHAVARSGEVRGRRVLVTGAGPIGALVVAVLARAGAAEIVVTDLHDRPLRVAEGLGATRTIVATDAASVAALGVDVAVESSGSPAGLAAAAAGLRRGGHLTLLGLVPAGDIPAPVAGLISREITVAGSFRFHDEMAAVLAALADGSLATEGIVSHVIPVHELAAALTTAADAAGSGKVLLDFTEPDAG